MSILYTVVTTHKTNYIYIGFVLETFSTTSLQALQTQEKVCVLVSKSKLLTAASLPKRCLKNLEHLKVQVSTMQVLLSSQTYLARQAGIHYLPDKE